MPTLLRLTRLTEMKKAFALFFIAAGLLSLVLTLRLYLAKNERVAVASEKNFVLRVGTSADILHQFEEPQTKSCCEIASQYKLDVLCPSEKVAYTLENDNCSCVDFMLCKLVVVTAFSSNHFNESVDFFGSVHAILPDTQIIVYDLGLSEAEVDAVQSYCHVKEIRRFQFELYPKHTARLFYYAWKPHIIEEISNEYELFFYCDASCRMTDAFIPFLPNILKFPLISLLRLPRIMSSIRYTHQGMLDYLKIKQTREEMMTVLRQSFQAGVLLVRVNDMLKTKILAPWVDCAEHLDCISPKGALRYNCQPKTEPIFAYVGCHRYDQSALNAILIREFGKSLNEIFNKYHHGIPATEVIVVEHDPTTFYDNSKSEQCNILYP